MYYVIADVCLYLLATECVRGLLSSTTTDWCSWQDSVQQYCIGCTVWCKVLPTSSVTGQI